MVNLLFISIFILSTVYAYSDEPYISTSNDETEPLYLYMDTRSAPSKSETRRSTFEKNAIRLGRSDLPAIPERNELDYDSYIDEYSQPVEKVEKNDYFRRSSKDNSNFLRFGRGSSDFLRFGRSKSDYMRFGRANNNFLRFGRGDRDFLRFGRGGNNFLRFGRDSSDFSRTTRDRKQNYLRFGRSMPETENVAKTRSKRDVSSQAPYKRGPNDFLRFGRNNEFLKFGRGADSNDDSLHLPTDKLDNYHRQSLNPAFLEKLKHFQGVPLVKLMTELACKMEQDNSKCVRLA